jgi:hypothetical protein
LLAWLLLAYSWLRYAEITAGQDLAASLQVEMPAGVLQHSRYIEDRAALSDYLLKRLSAELARISVTGRVSLLRHCSATMAEQPPSLLAAHCERLGGLNTLAGGQPGSAGLAVGDVSGSLAGHHRRQWRPVDVCAAADGPGLALDQSISPIASVHLAGACRCCSPCDMPGRNHG